ncbi:MAG: C39 family peptidase [archaeon]
MIMMLDVALIRKPKDSVYCGIACLNMVLEYYGITISFDKLKDEIEADSVGTYAPQLGSYLIKKGFDVEIVFLHPALFTNMDRGKKPDEIMAHLNSMSDCLNSERNKKALFYFIDFLKMGGSIKVKIPDKEDILVEIKEKRPLMALMTSNFLVGPNPNFDFNFNVITGIDERYVYVNDPSWNEHGGKQKHNVADFLYGVYVSSYGDLDNGCLIKIKKKGNAIG